MLTMLSMLTSMFTGVDQNLADSDFCEIIHRKIVKVPLFNSFSDGSFTINISAYHGVKEVV